MSILRKGIFSGSSHKWKQKNYPAKEVMLTDESIVSRNIETAIWRKILTIISILEEEE